MKSNWAEENLRAIRLMMENAAVYRRALAPVMGIVGATGLAAGAVGAGLDLEAPRQFIGFWVAVALVCMTETFLLIRRQAFKEVEPFWTPPARRVAQSVAPAFLAALVVAIIFWFLNPTDRLELLMVPSIWMVLYGLAMHSAGFSTPKGVRLFGWFFIVCGLAAVGSVVFLSGSDPAPITIPLANLGMGIFFGGGHAACGVFLHFTEKRGPVA